MKHEIYVAGIFAGLGFMLVLVYDLLYVGRQISAYNKKREVIEDIIFWIITGIISFIVLYQFHSGKSRLYIWGSIGVGIGINYFTVHTKFRSVIKHILDYFLLFLKKFLNQLLFYIKRCKIRTYDCRLLSLFYQKSREKRGKQVEKSRYKNQKKSNKQ